MTDLYLAGGKAVDKKQNHQRALDEMLKLLHDCCGDLDVTGIGGKPFSECTIAEIKAKTAKITETIEKKAREKHLKKRPKMGWQDIDPMLETASLDAAYGSRLTAEEREMFLMHDRDAKSLQCILA